MGCLLCLNLEQALKVKSNEYLQASSSSCSLVSSRFTAYMHVEMERARFELEDHRSACVYSVNPPASLPVTPALCLGPADKLHNSPIGAAA
ncbi:MAG: hypothetical protein P4L26_05155 [Terracidiphilus sp.]|nr:hypothetical protein [Terracidiphilus sp.]